MITNKQVKEIANKKNKKISSKAIEKIKKKLEKEVNEIIENASINSDFESRKIIKEKDLEF